MIPATSWVDSVGGIAAVINIAAVVVGGVWAYFKFAKGRTFAYRMELSLEGGLLVAGGVRALDVRVTLRNTGAAKVPLGQALKIVRVYGARRAEWLGDATLDWGDPLAIVEVLEHHAWIEAQEVIGDEVLVPVPSGEADQWLAYRCECMVVTGGRRGGGELRWTAYTVVPAALAGVNTAEEER